MRRNKSLKISVAILIIALGIMYINFQFYSFSDWVVRTVGIIMLMCIALISYNTVKSIKSIKS